MTTWRRRTGQIFVAFFALCFVLGLTAGDGAAQRSVEWLQYDVSLDVQSDGTVDVAEYQVIEFSGGPFSGGFADIPLDRIDRLDNVRVSQVVDGAITSYVYVRPGSYDGSAGTYTVVQTASDAVIDYGFESVTDETITILLEYSVFGVIRTYPEETPPNQQLWWTAISTEVTDIADIQAASVAIHLPEPVDPDEVIAGSEMVDLEAVNEDNQAWRWTRENMSAGDDLIVRLQFPPITAAPEPSWQQRVDQQAVDQEKADQRSALLNLLFLGIAGLGTVAGTIGLYGLWYTKGRDPYAPEVATFLAAPPDDLPPGVAGALLDEVAQDRDIIATLLDLAGRGILTLEEVPKEGIFGSSDFSMTLKSVPENLRPFETTMLKSLFGADLPLEKMGRFSEVKTRFAATADQLRIQIYDELVHRGYFNDRPDAVRNRWRNYSGWGLIAAAIVSFLLIRIFASDAGAVWIVPVVLFGLGLGLRLISAYMPRKTIAGVEAAKRWEAFKRYLDDIEKYEQIANHTEIFERYLPFVVAFGIEDSWVRKFASVSAPNPSWFEPASGLPGRRRGPVIIMGGGSGNQGGSWGGGKQRDSGGSGQGWPESGGGGASGFPDFGDLQQASDSAQQTLSNTSNSLFDMLASAAEAMSSGSGGGGGRGGGFGGSFGGGGFSGGGSGGGSSGGGGRGFR